ncbi:hypothetical protein LTR28_002469 [Elasticomyces elasticus]|nr:hypothetical protein LTR28_002469 [Elasticomyces elasticus]
MMSLFLLTIPMMNETAPSTEILLLQWKRVFQRGHVRGPALSVVTGVTYAYVVYAKSLHGQDWRGFALAGITTVSMIPYTWVAMADTNNKLWAAATGEPKASFGITEAKRLTTKWSRLNVARAMFPMVGGVE